VKVRVATYNVHRCRGMDNRLRPDRIVAVLEEIGADIVALQEVVCLEDGATDAHQARYLGEQLGLNWTLGENRKLEGAAYGNVVLSHFPLQVVTNHDLSVGRRERRGALHTDVRLSAADVLHVFNVHLGTAFLERRHQGRRLSDRQGGILHNEELTGPKIVLGDFNEWTTGLATRLLGSHLRSVDIRKYLGRSKTYPAFLPFMHLDHIYYDGPLELRGLTLHRSRTALVASDHLPLVADFEYLGRPAAAGTAQTTGTGTEPRTEG
jgi:endonuclease/exonuclease/phosphatase family metal-dependent hydrolase